ncbi:MAG: FAD-binding protein [archaeon]
MKKTSYLEKKKQLIKEFAEIQGNKSKIALGKKTTNLFRGHRKNQEKKRLNVRNFNEVINIDSKNQTAEVEGMTTFETFVTATLKKGFVPPVAPELKSITVGGAISGIGIESSCFKYGFVHETVLEMDILIGTGEIITCSPKKNSDLFYAIPNSYGTLGYVLRAKLILTPAKKYVKIIRKKYTDYEKYINEMKKYTIDARKNKTYDYIDGLVFKENEMYLHLGKFTNNPDFVSDYTKMNIFYKSMNKKIDFIKTEDYIFRYDTDWFWSAKSIGLENPILRRIFYMMGWLRSDVYRKILAWENKHQFQAKFNQKKGKLFESLIQDAEVELKDAAEFLSWFHKNITQRRPLTIGPVIPYSKTAHFTLFPMNPKKIFINIGYYASIVTDDSKPKDYYNRLFDEKIIKLKAKKMMYSHSTFTKKEFWNIFNKKAYDKLKAKYDPKSVFPDLYDKCVLKR